MIRILEYYNNTIDGNMNFSEAPEEVKTVIDLNNDAEYEKIRQLKNNAQ
jgi:hypothetical protein